MLKIILATMALALAAVLLFATMQDRMIGTDFDSGLASLRAMAEGT